jgi:ribonuclease D
MSNLHLHHEDLPSDLAFGSSVAIDTEAMGLNFHRDRLCLVQLSFGDDVCHMVKFSEGSTYHAPRLKSLISDPKILKIFHYGRFDMGIMAYRLGVMPQNVYCTKIASRLARTFTERHGLKELCRDLLGVEISKTEQTSDWGARELRVEQQKYAANDVLYLHRLKEALDLMLQREGRLPLAQQCWDFLPTRVALDLAGWIDQDIFAYNG